MGKRTNSSLQNEVHRLRRKVDALEAAYDNRAVLIRIAVALGTLHDYADPMPQTPLYSDGSRRPFRSVERAEPGSATRKWRSMERRHMKRLRQFANDLERDVAGTPAPVEISVVEREALTETNTP